MRSERAWTRQGRQGMVGTMADRTLVGVGVAVTRGEGPDGPLTTLLREQGAAVLDWGSVGFAPPEDRCPLLGSLARINDFDWICFSSPRAVEAVVSRVAEAPPDVKVAAVGPPPPWLCRRQVGRWIGSRSPGTGRAW